MDEENGTIFKEFVLKGFPGNPFVHQIMFVVLLLIYIVALAGNILIIVIICTDYRLHSPMYLFLVCLSFLELLAISLVLPKLLLILIGKTAISKAWCFTQSYLYYFVCTSDLLVLTLMSIDRFMAICYPLRYSAIMVNHICIKLVAACLITPFICLLYPTLVVSHLPFCANVLDHFFCETAAMLKLVCVDVSVLQLNTIFSSVVILIGCLIITTVSYILIVATVIRMPSDRGRQKTFSTCLSHLTMLSIFFGSAIFILIRPPKKYDMVTDKSVNLVSTVFAPLLNPFVYTLRNQKVKDCIRDGIKNIHVLKKSYQSNVNIMAANML